MTTRGHDVAVIGAGLAGSAAAIRLARGGRKTLLIEKEQNAKHKVCGEFISGEGLPYLKNLGIDLDAFGATSVSKFRLHGPLRSASARLPRAGRGVSRRALDEALIERAGEAGSLVLRGETVRGLIGLDGEVLLEGTSESHVAANVVCATGKTDFKPVEKRAGRDSGLVGFKMHLRLDPDAAERLKDHVDLFVFEGGYGGLVSIENGLANFCFLLRRELVTRWPREWTGLIRELGARNRALKDYLRDSDPMFRFPITIASVPYGFVRESALSTRVYCVGDQLAVIPSLTGDGMTIALMSAHRCVDHLTGGSDAKAFHREMAPILRRQVGYGFHIHRLFQHPALCDLAALGVNRIPQLVEAVFNRTRSIDIRAFDAGFAHG